jgi:hypothetical protein
VTYDSPKVPSLRGPALMPLVRVLSLSRRESLLGGQLQPVTTAEVQVGEPSCSLHAEPYQ